MVGFGISIFLITIGAIFKWAITAHLSAINLQALGVILMVVGAASFVLSIIFTSRSNDNPHELSSEDRGTSPPPNL